MRPVTRIQPGLPVQAMQTYRVASPVQTHTRPATCPEVGCKRYENGWKTIVPVGSEHEATVREMVTGQLDQYRRHFTERRVGDGLVEFRFEAGQMCFDLLRHRKSLQRPEFYTVRGGDWRANTGLIRRHTKPEFWVEDFAENQQKIARVTNG
jgi:hypothetical protein